jgi:hypothetical protein
VSEKLREHKVNRNIDIEKGAARDPTRHCPRLQEDTFKLSDGTRVLEPAQCPHGNNPNFSILICC